MNRRQKIIVSVVGIFIVLLALVGITYGYFLTRIQGNTNTTSITVTTANLILEYSDNGYILGSDAGVIIPDSNNPIGTKTFTVTNKGNATIDSYGVYLEDFYVRYANNATLEDGTEVTAGQSTKLNSPEDMKLVITCTASDGSTCNGYDGSLPTTNSLLLTNSVDVGVTHEYEMTLTYLETGEDQSADMNKTLNGLIQIYNQKDVVEIEGTVTGADANQYVLIESTPKLSQIINGKYKFVGVEPDEHTVSIVTVGTDGSVTKQASTDIEIIKGTSVGGNETTLTINDDSETATATIAYSKESRSVSVNFAEQVKITNPYKEGTLAYSIFSNDKIIKNTTTPTFNAAATNEEGMYRAEDDYGTSWYFRGAQTNNYVDFAGFPWRVVRINGDGSIRLILNGTLDSIIREGDTTSVSANTKLKEIDDDGKVEFRDENSFNSANAYVGYMFGLDWASENANMCITFNNEYLTADDSTSTYPTESECKNNGGKWTTTAYEATHVNVVDSKIKNYIDVFYDEYLLDFEDYISDNIFCADKTLASNGIGGASEQLGYSTYTTYYAAYERLYNNGNDMSATNPATPTLKCAEDANNNFSRFTVNDNTVNGVETNGDLTYPIALLSADELVMAGTFKANSSNINSKYYLNDDSYTGYRQWMTMTPMAHDYYTSVFSAEGRLLSNFVYSSSYSGVRPVINLRADILVDSGNGTTGSGAYTVKLPN